MRYVAAFELDLLSVALSIEVWMWIMMCVCVCGWVMAG